MMARTRLTLLIACLAAVATPALAPPQPEPTPVVHEPEGLVLVIEAPGYDTVEVAEYTWERPCLKDMEKLQAEAPRGVRIYCAYRQ